MRPTVLVVLVLLLLAGCSQPLTLASSCGGARDALCMPYAFSEVASASIEPAGLRPGQIAATAQVHVVLNTCGAMGPTHSVLLRARASGSGPLDDGGGGGVYNLAELHDDGMHGDAVAGDGMIDATIGNPFTTGIPGDTALTLEFVPHAEPYCDGTKLTVAYTTGPTFVAMP